MPAIPIRPLKAVALEDVIAPTPQLVALSAVRTRRIVGDQRETNAVAPAPGRVVSQA